jgi:HPt (histidine-containing phosphotransfer) domain-containing protein
MNHDAADLPAGEPAINWSRLDEMRRMEAEGMPGLAARLVRVYLENSQRLLGELQAAMASADAEAVRRAAHSIKSTSANIGANRLSQLARSLEHAAQTAEWRADQAVVDQIMAEHQAARLCLAERFAVE